MKVTIKRHRSGYQKSHRVIAGINILLGMFRRATKKQREIELANARLKKMNQDRKIGEISEGIKSNQLLLLDIKIDQEKLKLIALRRKVGSPDDFAPPSGE